jgi:hypothetical protein
MLRAADRECGCAQHPQGNNFQDYAGSRLEPGEGGAHRCREWRRGSDAAGTTSGEVVFQPAAPVSVASLKLTKDKNGGPSMRSRTPQSRSGFRFCTGATPPCARTGGGWNSSILRAAGRAYGPRARPARGSSQTPRHGPASSLGRQVICRSEGDCACGGRHHLPAKRSAALVEFIDAENGAPRRLRKAQRSHRRRWNSSKP